MKPIPTMIIMLCAIACSQPKSPVTKNQPKTDMGTRMHAVDSETRFEEFRSSKRKFILAKIADADLIPTREFRGKDELDSAVRDGFRGSLYYVFLKASDKAISLRLQRGTKSQPLEGSSLIFRMPNSPAFTYFLLDTNQPGTCALFIAQEKENVPLDNRLGDLNRLPLFWAKGEQGSIAYEELPQWMMNDSP